MKQENLNSYETTKTKIVENPSFQVRIDRR